VPAGAPSAIWSIDVFLAAAVFRACQEGVFFFSGVIWNSAPVILAGNARLHCQADHGSILKNLYVM